MRSVVAALVLTLTLAACASPSPPPSNSAPSAPSAAALPGVDHATPRADVPSEGTFPSADGVPIHYVSIGAQKSAVVFVHCWGCDWHEWDATMKHVAPRFRVVALDLAGHGASGHGRKEWTVRAFSEDVRAVVEGLGLDHVVLVGHSMGGPVIVDAALAMPARVVGLVPVDTLLDVNRSMTAEQRQKFFAPMHADFKAQTEKLVRSLFPKGADPAVVDRVVAMEIAGDPAILVPAIEDAFAYPEAERTAKLKVPVHGVNADLFPTNIAGNRTVMPGYDATIVHGVGHWLMLEKPADFATAIDQALATMPL
jgi:pimeloyl-ACP methyl ester carboxylesterase